MDRIKTERGFKFRIQSEKNKVNKKELKKLKKILKIKKLLSKNTDDQTKVVFWTENKHYTHIVHQEAAKIIGKNIKTTIETKSDEISPGYSEEDSSSNSNDAGNKNLFAEKVIQRVLEGEEIEAVVKSYPSMKDEIEMTFIVPFLKEGALFVRNVHAAKNHDSGVLNQSNHSDEESNMQKEDENKHEQEFEGSKLGLEDVEKNYENQELEGKDSLKVEDEILPRNLQKVKSIKEAVEEAYREQNIQPKMLKKTIKKRNSTKKSLNKAETD